MLNNIIRYLYRGLVGPGLAAALLCILAVAGCGGSSEGAADPGALPVGARTTVAVDVIVIDVIGDPIAGADVTIATGTVQQKGTTDADGFVTFANQPIGDVTLDVMADGFEPLSYGTLLSSDSSNRHVVALNATGHWAVGRAIVLGTDMVDLASDGSSMTLSVDVAVIDQDSQAIETLTSDNFVVVNVDCGWGGPRECASDADGNASGDGNFWPLGGAQAFGLQPPAGRHPYLVGVLAERSTAVSDWDERTPALKTFFSMLGGNDSAALASVQTEAGFSTLTVLGPYTSDGSAFFDFIDQLALPAGQVPGLQDSLLEWIRQATEAGAGAMPGTDLQVLVMATPEMSIPEINEAVDFARASGVRISTVGQSNYGLSEMAVRTGGFVTGVEDRRQLGMLFGAMDSLLAGTLSYYRMQFRIQGIRQTFVSGGNAKVLLNVQVPASIPHRGINIYFDVAID